MSSAETAEAGESAVCPKHAVRYRESDDGPVCPACERKERGQPALTALRRRVAGVLELRVPNEEMALASCDKRVQAGYGGTVVFRSSESGTVLGWSYVRQGDIVLSPPGEVVPAGESVTVTLEVGE